MWLHIALSCLCLLPLSLSVPSQERVTCPGDGVPAEKCDPTACTLPNCKCSGTDTDPLPINSRPQIVYLTFDDAFTAIAEELFYRDLFDGSVTNPNGCAIKATHFMTHAYTDYSLANKYWKMGHELASHSITHRNDAFGYWKTLDEAGWKDEMVGMRKMIGQFSAINPCEVKGTRAPYLQAGGDEMYNMLDNNGFVYDASWATRTYGYTDAYDGLYPYTLDYKSVQDCPIQPCPKCQHPGIWVQPLIDLEDEQIGANPQKPDNGMPCSMLDACVIRDPPYTQEHVYDMLMKNFMRVYEGGEDDFGDPIVGNRAPWGLFVHAAWFFGDQKWHYDGYVQFLKALTDTTKFPDVWIVPVIDGLEYMKAPLPHQVLMSLGKNDASPFGCTSIEEETGIYDSKLFRCGNPQSCKFNVTLPEDNVLAQERYMAICSHWSNTDGTDGGRQSCPDTYNYPWLGEDNHCGGNVPCLDCEA